MSKTPSLTGALSVLSLLLASAMPAQGKDEEKNKEKSVPYAVVRVDSEVRVVKKSEVKALMKQVDADYKKAVKEHSDASKAARKKKEKFDQPKPKKQKVKVLKATCKDEAEANKYVEDLKAAESKKRDKGDKGDKGDRKKSAKGG